MGPCTSILPTEVFTLMHHGRRSKPWPPKKPGSWQGLEDWLKLVQSVMPREVRGRARFFSEPLRAASKFPFFEARSIKVPLGILEAGLQLAFHWLSTVEVPPQPSSVSLESVEAGHA